MQLKTNNIPQYFPLWHFYKQTLYLLLFMYCLIFLCMKMVFFTNRNVTREKSLSWCTNRIKIRSKTNSSPKLDKDWNLLAIWTKVKKKETKEQCQTHFHVPIATYFSDALISNIDKHRALMLCVGTGYNMARLIILKVKTLVITYACIFI